MDRKWASTTCYLAEIFKPRRVVAGQSAEVERVRQAAERLSLAGVSVRHVRSLYIADEETALHLFEAEDQTAVEQALRDAGLEADRIGPVIEMADGGGEGQRRKLRQPRGDGSTGVASALR